LVSAKKVFVICGPTAVGKTAIAIDLAKQLGTAIISADSRQCYKEMTIGTAKPSAQQLAEVKHYFINEFSVTASLTAADFEKLSLNYLDEIFTNQNTAVVCGGTGLYIKALCEGLDDMPQVDEALAATINATYKEHGLEWLQLQVEKEDPEFYAEGEVANPARLLRALIFKRSSGQSILNYRTGNKKQRPFRIIKIGLELPRTTLYHRINHRVDIMLQDGLLEEVKQLYPLKHLKNLQTVGYSELFEHLDGKYTYPEAVDKIKQNTRHYAKRQMTWFKKDPEINWLSADSDNIVDNILSAHPR